MAKAGAFVSIRDNGAVYVERGFQRPEDAAPKPPAPANGQSGARPAANDAFSAASSMSEEPNASIRWRTKKPGPPCPNAC